MTKKKSPKGKDKITFMFPLLHPSIMDAVSSEMDSPWFCKDDTSDGTSHRYSTNVMGKFKCNNRGCSNSGWGSKMVAILIRRYPENGYNAVVFNQRCKYCNKLGAFTLDEESYISRVAYRLKKWAGVQVNDGIYISKKGPPHESSLCEGCKRNVCRQTNNSEYY